MNDGTPPPHQQRKCQHHCLEIWAIPQTAYEALSPDGALDDVLPSLTRSSDGPFPPGSLDVRAPISRGDEALALAFLFVTLGGPVFWAMGMIFALLFGHVKLAAVVSSVVLAFHPLPRSKAFTEYFRTSRVTLALYRYFTYRFIWKDGDLEAAREAAPWIGAGPPHGVLPFANVLSIPAINSIGIPFVGAPANVVFRTPFLRLLTVYPCVPVDRRSIARSIEEDLCVGLVPDGIAGIFRQNPHREVVALAHRKGIARLALRTGTPVLPAYSFGNTSAFSAWWDSFKILERLSRRAQASIFLYWGRFGLPIPRRAQITMVFGRVIQVEKVENPTAEQVDELHERLLDGIRSCFEDHKKALGWGDKDLVFE